MNLKHKLLKSGAFALVFGSAMLVGASATANAQGDSRHHERDDLKDHQRQERSYEGNSHQTRDHQRLERDQLKYEQRVEHNGYPVTHAQSNHGGYNNNGYYNGPNNNGYYGNVPSNNGHSHNNSGYYGNNGGYYGNDPYYNNNGHSHGGYYGNNRSYGNNGYYRPHRDSRNPIRRGIHHALGGH